MHFDFVCVRARIYCIRYENECLPQRSLPSTHAHTAPMDTRKGTYTCLGHLRVGS